jgi:hypothetical protein
MVRVETNALHHVIEDGFQSYDREELEVVQEKE